MTSREELVAIAREAIDANAGDVLTRRFLEPEVLPRGRTVLLALGKAAAAMARGAVDVLGPLPGLVVGLPGDAVPEGLELAAGDHPVPGPASQRAGERLLEVARSLGSGDTALVLISGGGSALAEVPAAGLTLHDVAEATRTLLRSGAPIEVINAVRRRLSRIKGGGLAAALGTRRVLALALSDVAGDDPAVIASGPLTPAPAEVPPEVEALLPPHVRERLRAADAGRPSFPVHVLAGPTHLARTAAEAARRRGLPCDVLPHFLAGDAGSIARSWIARAGGDRVIAAAAEPTLYVPSDAGTGGRSQHLALLVAGGIRGTSAAFLAEGSDGRDGPTDHAGAAVDGTTDDGSLDADLARLNSAGACARRGVALPRRSTGTNLADLHLLMGDGARRRP